MNGHMRFMHDVVLYVAVGLLALAALLYVLGNYTFWLPFRSSKLPRIVMLHQVTPKDAASGMNMPPEKFEQLLTLLTRKGAIFALFLSLNNIVIKRMWLL